MIKYLNFLIAFAFFASCAPSNGESKKPTQTNSVKVNPVLSESEEEKGTVILQTKDFPSGNRAKKLVYKDHQLIKETSITTGIGYRVQLDVSYDDHQRIIETRNTENSIWTNKRIEYLQDDLLLSEHIEEFDGENTKETLYTYEYPDVISNSMVFYKLKDGERVSEMKLVVQDKTEVLTERVLIPKHLKLLKTTTRLKDDHDRIIEEHVQSIGHLKIGSNEIDTVDIDPTRYEYDQDGNITVKYHTDLMGNRNITFNTYDENGYLRKNRVTQKGKTVMKFKLDVK